MSALPIFTASRPATIVSANELNFCVRNGPAHTRCLWQMKRGRGLCRGRQKTSPPRWTLFSPGTANRKQVEPVPI